VGRGTALAALAEQQRTTQTALIEEWIRSLPEPPRVIPPP